MIKDEKSFQKWFTGVLLPLISPDSTSFVSQSGNLNGVSDIIWIVPGKGVFAMELKYAKASGVSQNKKLLSHKLSVLQSRFMEKWASSQKNIHSVVVVATDLSDILFYTGDQVFNREVNYMTPANMVELSSFSVSGPIFGKGRRSIQTSPPLVKSLKTLRANLIGKVRKDG